MDTEKQELKHNVKNRLSRIEGQVKGVQRMIDEEQNCSDVLTQIAAIRSAINKVGGLVLDMYSKECIIKALDNQEKQQALDDLTSTIQKFLKFVE